MRATRNLLDDVRKTISVVKQDKRDFKTKFFRAIIHRLIVVKYWNLLKNNYLFIIRICSTYRVDPDAEDTSVQNLREESKYDLNIYS